VNEGLARPAGAPDTPGEEVRSGDALWRFADATVTMPDQGYLDDSVRGYQYHVVLAKLPGGHWQLTRATRAWTCWRGRGHEGFSAEPCR